MNKNHVYDAALALWGYDRQVLTTAEECNELAAACARFVNHKANGNRIAEEAADVEIMIEQLRHNGMSEMIDQHKIQKMDRLARRVEVALDSVLPASPSVSAMLEEAVEQLEMAQALYIDRQSSNRLAAARTRRCIALLMQAAQNMMREQQLAEQSMGARL